MLSYEMIKHRDILINYGTHNSLRVTWFFDRNKKREFRFNSKKVYRKSRFWQPVRREITVFFMRWTLVVESLVSILSHPKKKKPNTR